MSSAPAIGTDHRPWHELVTVKKPGKLDGVENTTDVLLMDLLWLKGSAVVHAFGRVHDHDDEWTPARLNPQSPPRIMVIPEERSDLKQKMESPLFSEHFSKDGWALVFFGALREAFSRTRRRPPLRRCAAKSKGFVALEADGTCRHDLFLFGVEKAASRRSHSGGRRSTAGD